jgi:hypothetical protein
MKNPIETIKGTLQWYGGYILIPNEYRETFDLSDGCGDNKTARIKSIVSVCETPLNTDEQGDITQVKVIDEDDTMWDAEEYMDTDALKELVIICGKIDSKAIR